MGLINRNVHGGSPPWGISRCKPLASGYLRCGSIELSGRTLWRWASVRSSPSPNAVSFAIPHFPCPSQSCFAPVGLSDSNSQSSQGSYPVLPRKTCSLPKNVHEAHGKPTDRGHRSEFTSTDTPNVYSVGARLLRASLTSSSFGSWLDHPRGWVPFYKRASKHSYMNTPSRCLEKNAWMFLQAMASALLCCFRPLLGGMITSPKARLFSTHQADLSVYPSA
jgi:hypothetical protein